jgi:hypothetical protein
MTYQQFIILAGLCLLCNSSVSAGDSTVVSGYSVPLDEGEAKLEGYQPERVGFSNAAPGRGYTNAHAGPMQLCRAFAQPDASHVYMIAVYMEGRGCTAAYTKQLK